MASNLILCSRTKYIEVDVYYVRQQVAAKLLKVQCVSTDYQVVEFFTKSLSVAKFTQLRDKLSMTEKVIV